MMEEYLSSEDDLWKLFRTTLPEDGHELLGEGARKFQYIRNAIYYRVKRYEKRRPLFKLKDETRFYYLHSRSAAAVVPQSALLKIGRVMYARDQDLTVQYLGTSPDNEGSNSNRATHLRDNQPSSQAKIKTRKTRRRAPGSEHRRGISTIPPAV
jgi:hypothetical protein